MREMWEGKPERGTGELSGGDGAFQIGALVTRMYILI